MPKYTELENRLAALMRDADTPLFLTPRWTRDWNACGPLMVKFGIEVDPLSVACRYVLNGEHSAYITTAMVDHPDRDTAVRYAIVMAVIELLEKGKTK